MYKLTGMYRSRTYILHTDEYLLLATLAASAELPGGRAGFRGLGRSRACRAREPSGPNLEPVSTYVAVFALVLAYFALVASYIALRTLAKLRRATAVIARGARGPEAHASIVEITQRNSERTEIVAEELTELRALIAEGRRDGVRRGGETSGGQGALRNVALVRYDAFSEMSGRMSFSLALLDGKGDGVTISAIAGASDTRVYAKGVADGKGEHDLSPEEAQAVASALERRRGLPGRRAG